MDRHRLPKSKRSHLVPIPRPHVTPSQERHPTKTHFLSRAEPIKKLDRKACPVGESRASGSPNNTDRFGLWVDCWPPSATAISHQLLPCLLRFLLPPPHPSTHPPLSAESCGATAAPLLKPSPSPSPSPSPTRKCRLQQLRPSSPCP